MIWINKRHEYIYIAFNVFELCCGVYFPTMGSLKSAMIPESMRSTIMNIFRIPLNIVVVLVLLKMDSMTNATRFGICAGMCLFGAFGGLILSRSVPKPTKQKNE